MVWGGNMRILISPVALAAMLACIGSASGQSYPSRPISMIVPYPAGGPTDMIGRVVAERMRVSLGQPITIDNIGGAAGSIGIGRLARAVPDGYTFGIGNWSTHVVNGAVYRLQYDVLNDFAPVALIVDSPLLIVAKKTVPAKNLNELIAWLKANPDKASLGTPGTGSSSHIAGIFLQKLTGTRLQFVPYRGLGPAMQDMLAGQIDMMFDAPANSLPQVHAGNINVYAVTARSRLVAAPDVPTVDEAGLPGLYISVWQALFVPKGTSKAVVSKLNAAAVEALADPAVQRRLADLSQELPPRDQQIPEALGAFQRAEIEKWWPIVKGANIKAE
jgi:tripartite-type tricarboxylate transporter receptor subunit TctC